MKENLIGSKEKNSHQREQKFSGNRTKIFSKEACSSKMELFSAKGT